MERQNLDWSDSTPVRAVAASPLVGGDGAGTQPQAQAMVIENVLVSVTAGMSSKNKEIVMDTVQYATMVAGNSRKSVECMSGLPAP